MPVREAVVDDVAEICALITALADYEELRDQVVYDAGEMRRHLFETDPPAARVLIAETSGTPPVVAGFALWVWTFSTFSGRPGIWLEDLFVKPEHRGQGFGRALLERLRGLTDDRIEWAVLDWNQPSIDFYDRLGAHPVDGWTRYRWLPS
jgi:GNAT superfamily N-acetyltransferase